MRLAIDTPRPCIPRDRRGIVGLDDHLHLCTPHREVRHPKPALPVTPAKRLLDLPEELLSAQTADVALHVPDRQDRHRSGDGGAPVVRDPRARLGSGAAVVTKKPLLSIHATRLAKGSDIARVA